MTNKRTGAIPIQAYDAPSSPFERVHLDLTGANLPTTPRGNRYILVLKDSLTGYVEIYAIKDKSELTVANVVVDKIYCRHGAPAKICTDQGTEFLNKLLDQIYALLAIGRMRTTPANPQANGLVENHNRTLKEMLGSVTAASQDDWDLSLSHVAFAYNTTVSARTGFTPFFMMYGREARQLSSQWIDTFAAKTPNPESYVVRLVQTLQLCWDFAAARKDKEVDKFNRTPRTRLPFVEFRVGERFFHSNHPSPTFTQPGQPASQAQRISVNFQHRWTGPYTVTKKFSPVLYEAIINSKATVVHALRMQRDPIGPALRGFAELPEVAWTALRRREHEAHRVLSEAKEADRAVDE